MHFTTREEIEARKNAAADALDKLKGDVAFCDSDPILAGSDYDHGDFWDGCYAGLVLNKNDTHVALYSKRANRVVIIPSQKNSPQIGSVVSMTSFGSILRTVRQLTPSYDWLDAMDDYIVALRNLQLFDLATSGIRGDALVLARNGSVAGSYRDMHQYRMQEERRWQQ